MRSNGPRTNTWAWAAWVIVCVVWGTTYLAIRISLETLPPALMAAMRWLAAGGLLALGLWFRSERWPEVRQWPGLAVIGLLMIGLGNGGVVWAQQFVPSGLTAVIVATVPFWMVGVEAALPTGERLSRRAATGLIVGFGGIVMLVWPEVRQGGGSAMQFGLGVAALQVACVGWALGSIYSRRHATNASVAASTALQMVFGGVLMLIVGLVAGEQQAVTFSQRSALSLAYLIGAGSIGGFLAYAYALRHLPVSTVSTYAYVNPVIAVLLGAMFGEPLTVRIAVAAGLVLIGVAIVRWSPTVSFAAGTRAAIAFGRKMTNRLAQQWRREAS
jgi:drug/metabolite transporter (DMT)-like permease